MSSSENPSDQIRLHEVYAEELRFHAVTFVWLGFGQLNASGLSTAEEDHITQELVRAMKLIQVDPASPEWVDRYQIHEQSPQVVDGKIGKRRPKMDIEFECHRRRVRPKLGFEAKRLGNGKSVGDYLGVEGLAAFVNGYYPTTHGEAGMLGYIQEASVESWASKLSAELTRRAKAHAVKAAWAENGAREGQRFYSTTHQSNGAARLIITHILLPFVAEE